MIIRFLLASFICFPAFGISKMTVKEHTRFVMWNLGVKELKVKKESNPKASQARSYRATPEEIGRILKKYQL